MQAGRLDQRVTIERLTTTRNPQTGAVIETWTVLAEVWAAVEPLNGRELFAAAASMAEVGTRIRMRYRPYLLNTDRINHEGKLHDIISIINPRTSDRELVLMCKAWAA